VFAHAQVLFFVILSVAEWASPFGIGNGVAVVWFALEILLTAVCMFTLKTKVLEADWAGTKLLDNPLGNGVRFISSKIGDITRVLIGAIAAIVVGLVIKNGGEAPDPEVMTWLAFPGKLWLNGLKVKQENNISKSKCTQHTHMHTHVCPHEIAFLFFLAAHRHAHDLCQYRDFRCEPQDAPGRSQTRFVFFRRLCCLP
jgi:hypothetical protein